MRNRKNRKNTEKRISNHSLYELDRENKAGRRIWGKSITIALLAVLVSLMMPLTALASDPTDPPGSVPPCEPGAHKWGEWKTVKEPTCVDKGSKERVCSVCSSKETGEIDLADHTYGEGKVTKEPTCETDGAELFTCKVCGTEKTVVLPKLGHDWVTVSDTSTCTSSGTMIKACKHANCDKGGLITEPSAGGHNWQVYSDTTTCTKAGVITYICTNDDCPVGTKKVERPKKEHQLMGVQIQTKAATCTAAGKEYQVCSVCKTEVTERVLNALGHAWNEGKVSKEPTCTATGTRTFNCTRCNTSKTETIAAKGHSYGNQEITEKPTCTTSGQATRTCPDCNSKITETLPKLSQNGEHTWDQGAITALSTEDEEGEMTFTCLVCAEQKTEPIPMLASETETEQEVTEASDTGDGESVYDGSSDVDGGYYGQDDPDFNNWDGQDEDEEQDDEDDTAGGFEDGDGDGTGGGYSSGGDDYGYYADDTYNIPLIVGTALVLVGGVIAGVMTFGGGRRSPYTSGPEKRKKVKRA